MNTRRHAPVAITRLVLAVLILVVLLTANLRVLLSLNYIDWQYGRLQESRVAPDRPTMAAARPIIEYLQHRRETLSQLVEKERDHLVDVRLVFDLTFISTFVGIAVLAAVIVAVRKWAPAGRLPRDLMFAALIAAAVLVGLLAVVALDFTGLFDRFHGLFFRGGSWLFPPDSTLVRLFPFAFWMNAARDWVLLTLIELVAIAAGTAVGMRTPGIGTRYQERRL